MAEIPLGDHSVLVAGHRDGEVVVLIADSGAHSELGVGNALFIDISAVARS